MERLTSSEREEIESLSAALFNGKTSVWQKPVKKGVVEPVLDEDGKQVYHKGIPVSRIAYKTEHQVLEQLRDLNAKKIAFEKAQAEEQERQRKEQEIKQQVAEAAGRMGR